MKDKLVQVLKNCETKALGELFKIYMESKSIRKCDRRRKDNSVSYLVDGESTGWNRVSCYYRNGSEKYGDEDLAITLRKRSGFYLIVERKSVRAFEYDYELRSYDDNLLNEIYKDHKELFDSLFDLFSLI